MQFVPQNKEAIVKTVDIYGTPDYKENAFTRTFAKKHNLEFDLMFLMDCGGDFMKSQPEYSGMYEENDRYIMKMNFINKIVHFTSNMLKPGGSMFLYKISNDIKSIYAEKFLKRRWNVGEHTFAKTSTYYLKITRPTLRF